MTEATTRSPRDMGPQFNKKKIKKEKKLLMVE